MRNARALFVLGIAACGGGDPASPDATTPTPDAAPIVTPENVWTWVEIPGTTCANGSPFGFGVNRSTVSPDLFVFFQGGGACWDGNSCFVQKMSAHIEDTYTAETMAAEGYSGTVNHAADPTNPVAMGTFIYIPYCTGDLHAGTIVRDYQVGNGTRSVAHVGANNTQIFVDTLRVTFPDAQTIWLAGSSAGGYGATFNLHRFATAYPNAAVHLLQDGSPYVQASNWTTWHEAWQLAFPPDCTECATSTPRVVDAVATRHPSSRIGLLHYDDDRVIKWYFGYADTAGAMVPATNALLDNQYQRSNTKAFVLAGLGHTMLSQINTLQSPDGVRLSDWVLQWARGEAGWRTVRP